MHNIASGRWRCPASTAFARLHLQPRKGFIYVSPPEAQRRAPREYREVVAVAVPEAATGLGVAQASVELNDEPTKNPIAYDSATVNPLADLAGTGGQTVGFEDSVASQGGSSTPATWTPRPVPMLPRSVGVRPTTGCGSQVRPSLPRRRRGRPVAIYTHPPVLGSGSWSIPGSPSTGQPIGLHLASPPLRCPFVCLS